MIAEEKAAELKIKQAASGLERMEVVAPHDGIFVYARSEQKAGDMVYPGRPLGRLPLVETMEAEVFVALHTANQARLGAGCLEAVKDVPL